MKFDPDPDVLPPGSGRWTRVAAGAAHTCALDLQNQLFCWGRNLDGETGRGTTDTSFPEPGAVDSETWSKISTSAATTCGIRGGALFCWGNNSVGQVGDNPNLADAENDDRMTPKPIGSGTWLDIAVSNGHACAIKDDNTVWCWGLNSAGQVGNNSTTTQGAPVQVAGTTTFSKVAVGANTTCAIAGDSSLYCWGDNQNSAYGMGGPSSPMPLPIPGESWSHIAVGESFGCGITTTGALRCWGRNTRGQVGDGTQMNRSAPTPVTVPDGLTWVQVVANEKSACARSADGRVFCWGDSTMGQLTVFDDILSPTEIAGDAPWADVAIGNGHACFLGTNYQLFCAGKNGFSQLSGTSSSSNIPVSVPGKWREVATGHGFTCAVDTDGRVKCAGRNQIGQLGTGTTTYAMTMTQTAGPLDGTVDLAAGIDHACAQNGTTIYCWGGNYTYQLGLNDTNDRHTPTVIRNGTVPSANMHTCTIDNTNSRLYCWGTNERYHINSTGQDVMSPFEVTAGQTWTAVAAGRYHTCAIETTSGAIYCLGDRYQVGVTPPAMDSATLRFTGRAGMNTIAAGSYHTCATTTTPSIQGYCWGSGYAGQLGFGDLGRRDVPTQLPGAWTKFAAGEIHTCGIQTGGALYCFGDNTFGQLGLPSGDPSTTPALVSNGPWRTVAAADLHTCAITQDFDLYCWGNNNDGELANGMAWDRELHPIP